MKRWVLSYIGLLLFLATALVVPAMASDISGADYYGIIQVSNNSTAASVVSVNISGLNSASLISQGWLNATATDAAIQKSGSDIPFMPGYDDNAWIMFVNSIGANSGENYGFYTDSASGGKIRYFPAAGGMTTADITPDFGDNWTWEADGWLSTSANTSKYDLEKEDAMIIGVSNSVSGNYSVQISPAGSPTGHTDPSAKWTNETNAYDDNTATYATCQNIPTTSWSGNITLSRVATNINGVSFWATRSNAAVNLVNIDVYHDAAWHDVYQGNWTTGRWVYIPYSHSAVSDIRFSFYNSSGGSTYDAYLNEVKYGIVTQLTATGITSGEHNRLVTQGVTIPPNGSFEFGNPPDSWTAGSATVTRETAPTPQYGHYVVKIVSTAINGEVRYSFPDYVDYRGVTVSVRAQVQASSARAQQTRGLSLYDGVTTTWNAAGNIPNDDAWHTAYLTKTVSAAASELTIHFYSDEGWGNVGEILYVDGVRLIESATPADYVGNFQLIIDGTVEDSADLEFSIPDNANDIQSFLNGVAPYVEYQKIWIGGSLQQYIAWEYGATFTDLSGNGHPATPTFRETTSDPDVSAMLLSFAPTSTPEAPAYAVGSGPDFYSDNISISEDFTANVTGGSTGYPGQRLINALSTATATPQQFPEVLIWGFVIIAVSITMTIWIKSAFVKMLWICCGLGIGIAVRDAATGLGVFDLWMLVFFMIFAIMILYAANERTRA